MFLKISQLQSAEIDISENHFPAFYKNSLSQKSTYRESLFARYLISYYIGQNYLPQVNEDGIPDFQDAHCWSIAHKKKLVFVGVSDAPIGLDIEVIKPRDMSLLDGYSQEEYRILSGESWESFYTLWCAHEALIKRLRMRQDIRGEIELQSREDIMQEISGISFQKELKVFYAERSYAILIGREGDLIYSLCT